MNCCRWFEKADVSNQPLMCKTIFFYEILVNVCKFDQGSIAMTTRRSSFQSTCLSFLERSSKNFLSCSSRLRGSSLFGGGTIGLHRPFGCWVPPVNSTDNWLMRVFETSSDSFASAFFSFVLWRTPLALSFYLALSLRRALSEILFT